MMNRNLWLAVVFACLAFLFRTQGMVLVAAMLVWFVVKRQYKAAVVLSAMFTPLFLLFNTGKYGGDLLLKNPYNTALGRVGFGDLVARMTENFARYCFSILPQAMLPLCGWQGLSVVVGVIVLFLIYRGVKK